jgi:hypothetical protein
MQKISSSEKIIFFTVHGNRRVITVFTTLATGPYPGADESNPLTTSYTVSLK